MQDILPILLETPLFAGIGPEDLSGMLICLGARKQVFQKGSSIFTEGDEAVSMGLVVTGLVLLVRDDIYGNRSILARIGPKQLFGESYAFSREKRLPVSVVAEQEASVLIFDSRRLTSCCHNACCKACKCSPKRQRHFLFQKNNTGSTGCCSYKRKHNSL